MQDFIHDEPVTDLAAPKWQQKLDEAFNDFMHSGECTPDGFTQLLWDHAILGVIAPEDPKDQEARRTKGEPVWDNREDPHLYWQLLYSIASAAHYSNSQYSIATSSSGLVYGAFGVIVRLMGEHNDLYRQIYPQPEHQRNIAHIFDDLLEKARRELENRGQSTNGHPLQIGMQGSYEGIPFTIDTITDQGGIKTGEMSGPDYRRMGDITAELGRKPGQLGQLYPWEIDPTLFSFPEGPDKKQTLL